MPSHIRYPSWLVFRIPTQFQLIEKFELTDSISLWPGARYEPTPQDTVGILGCTILYVERNPPSEQFGPPRWPAVVSHNNLREFILFWSFLTREAWAIHAFERGKEPTLLDTPPDETPSSWDNNPCPLNPRRFSVEDHTMSLDTAFATFKAAGPNRDLAALLMHHRNRHVTNRARVLYNNYLLDASLMWFVIDALLPPEKCGTQSPCPKCKKTIYISHPIESFRTRAERALGGFKRAVEYVALLDKLRSVRGEFVHDATSETLPNIHYPDPDPATGERRWQVTLDQTLTAFGAEGAATESALMIGREVAYWLVFNRIFPGFNIRPDRGNLEMVATG